MVEPVPEVSVTEEPTPEVVIPEEPIPVNSSNKAAAEPPVVVAVEASVVEAPVVEPPVVEPPVVAVEPPVVAVAVDLGE